MPLLRKTLIFLMPKTQSVKAIRQLSAILFTDIVGYSALMARDEAQAIGLLERSRQVQMPLVEQHRGQWVKELGDGAIIIFTSVLSALECALAIQAAGREVDGLRFKMALHSGEIILKNGDVFGDGVNVAARMEHLARGSVILLSDKANREIRNIHTIETRALGHFRFKNLDEPVGLYAVVHPHLDVPDLSTSPLRIVRPETSDGIASAEGQFEEQVRAFIQENLDSPDLTVVSIARAVGYSRAQLYRKVREQTGRSPSDLLREMRLQRAKELLEQGAGNVSEVAHETGFENLSHFSKIFQERFGRPPSSYLKRKTSRLDLPVALSRFIGREKEIADAAELVRKARLLTLTGTGGTGKTRLAMELMRTIADQFRDGAFFVPLAPVPSHEQVAPKVAQVMKVQQDPSRRTTEVLADHIADREILLVLDNFEHVLPAARVVKSLLTSCPNLKVLVSSRIVLNLAGEYEYAVPQLAYPEADRTYTPEELAATPAVEFFLDRVRSFKPQFQLTEANKETVAGICRTLDGLPLGLELAAARIKIFPPEALLKRLKNNLDILKSSGPDLPQRHRSLINAIDWSYGLLSPEEQTLFRRLSVFSGGFTLEAAEEVCLQDYAGQVDLLDIISDLLDKSMLQQQEQADGEPRFNMLETIKAFGQGRLQRSLELEDVMDRYAAYFQRKMEEAEQQLTGPDMVTWLDYIERELDNLRAIFLWIEKKQDSDRGLRFAVSFWRYWTIRSMMREGANWLKRMLDIPAAKKESIWRCKTLNAYGVLFGITQAFENTKAIFRESLQMARDIGYKEGEGKALTYLSWVNQHSLNLDLCEEYAEEALAIHQELGNKRDLATTHNNLGWVAAYKGEVKKSIAHHETAAQIMRSIGEIRGFAYNNCRLAWGFALSGQYDRSRELSRKALRVFTELEDKQLIALAFSTQALVECYTANVRESLRLTSLAEPLWANAGNKYGDILGYVIRTMCHLHLKEFSQIEALMEHADHEASIAKELYYWLRQLKNRFYLYTSRPDEAMIRVKTNISDILARKIGWLLPDELTLYAHLLGEKKFFWSGIPLFSFAEKLRHDHQLKLPPLWQASHQNTLDLLQDSLEKKEFDTLWQQGQRMTREDIPAMLDLH